MSAKRQGTMIDVDSTITVTDDKFTCIAANNCSPKFRTPVLENAVILGIDNDENTCYSSFTFSITLELSKKALKSPGTTEKDTITLYLEWDPAAGIITKDKHIYRTEGYIEITSKVLSYTSSLLGNVVPDNIYIENIINKERYYGLNYTGTAISINSITSGQADELTVSWVAIPGAEEYDLEWLYMDDFGDYVPGSGVTYKSASSIPVDFRFDATGVTVKGTSHTLKNIYQHGYLLFRVRFVGRDTVTYAQRLESRWSSHSFGSTVSTFGTNNVDRYQITSNHEDTLNWQWTTSFAEEGKSKTVISYFDGSLRSRQMVTYTNTDQLTIVAESFYDHVGRKAVDALPVPTGDSIIKFYRNFNLSAYNQKTYSWKDFDTSQTALSCNNSLTGMDTLSGASRYYSHNNPDKNLYQAYVPDAKMYPFVQVEFMPDNTGRIRRQSGVGIDHRMGSGHETQYFYGKPTQQELDMLFGVEVGDFNRYKKNMVVDPNGSISVSYMNPAGKVIATALAGENPSNLAVLPADTNRQRIVEELSQSIPAVDSTGMKISITHDLLLSSPAQVDFDYGINKNTLQMSCANICFDCVYDVKFSVTDICRNFLHDTTFIGIKPLDTLCGNDTFSHSFSLALDKGSYRVSKELSVNLEALEYYEEVYVRNNVCARTLQEIYDSLENEIDYTECENSCDKCLDRLGSLNDYKTSRFDDLDTNGLDIDSLITEFEKEYEFYKEKCEEMCDTPSTCESDYARLLQDIAPGGQYAMYVNTDSTGFLVTDKLSFLDSTTNNTFANYYSWPRDWRNDSLTYYNSDGGIDSVWFDSAWRRPNDLPDSIFVQFWKPEWAHALVKMHPEYCYYKWCILNEASNKFDYRMQTKATWTMAQNDSLFDPLHMATSTFPNSAEDPFFKAGGLGGSYSITMQNKINDYATDGTNNYTMWEAAAIATFCTYETTPSGTSTCLASHPFGSGTNDELISQWSFFRSFYLSAKQEVKETVRAAYATTNSCSNCYIGNNGQPPISTSCSTVFTMDSLKTKQKQFPSLKEATGVNPDSSSNLSYQQDVIRRAKEDTKRNIESSCQSQCESYAHQWMLALKNCDGFSTDSAALRDSLINICKLGCDVYNPFGAREVSPENSTKVTRQNFKEVLDYFFTSNKVCNEDLIPFPYAYKHDYAGSEFVPVDDCFEGIVNDFLSAACTRTDEVDALEALLGDIAFGGKLVSPSEIDIISNVSSGSWTDYVNHLMSYTSGHQDSFNKYVTTISGGKLVAEIKSRNNLSWNSCTITFIPPQGYTTSLFSSITSTGLVLSTPDYSKTPLWKEFTIFMYDASSNEYQVKAYSSCYPVCTETDPVWEWLDDSLNNAYCKNFTENDVRDILRVMYDDTLAVAFVPRDLSCKAKCITCDRMNLASSAFWGDYNSVYTQSDSVDKDTNFTKVYANYVNRYLGLNKDYFTLKDFKTTCDSFYINETAPFYNYNRYRSVSNGCETLPSGKQDTLLNLLSMCDDPLEIPMDTLSCDSLLRLQAYDEALFLYNEQMDTLRGNFRRQYLRKCMNIAGLETFTMAYDIKQYHYTLYYYDQADNLIKSVPPAGVRLITHPDTLALVYNNRKNKVAANYSNTPHHVLVTNYKYNTLNAVFEQSTPDGGITEFFYDRLGRLAVSQNAKQAGDTSYYSYTHYDALGRITEVGETRNLTAITDATSRNPALLASWHSSAVWFKQVTKTFYDNKAGGFVDSQFTNGPDYAVNYSGKGQQNLRNRVAYVTFDNDGTGAYDYATYYNYDLHGNVKELVHDYTQLQALAYGYFKIVYEYDLISGNVNKVSYQKGKQDQFFHKYFYDADNRIRQVFTSRDNLIWDNDAKYFYYQHGPLARTEIGELKVQGMDYAYTIHGWLKGVNSGTLDSSRDIGKDGWWSLTNNRRFIPKDEFGFTLGYYDGDYYDIAQKTTAQHFEVGITSGFNNASYSLFNGNIRHMVVAIGKFMEGDPSTSSGRPMGYAYKYDHLNRLASMDAYDSINMATNEWYTTATAMSQYHNRFTYDANGNILSQVRHGAASINEALDSLVYKYYPGTNRLSHVDDIVNAGNYNDDIDDQDSLNYTYDPIGNLISDQAEEIDSIQWTVYGKISRIIRTPGSLKAGLEFEYSPDGQRVMKRVTYPNDSLGTSHTEYYVRDAQGNIMATYTVSNPYFELLDTSYDKIIGKLIDSMGIASFANFIQTRFSNNPGFYTKLGKYIPDSVMLDSFTTAEILSCTGDEIFSKLFSCCGNCGDYPMRNIMLEILGPISDAVGESLTDNLLACNPQLVLEAMLAFDGEGFLDAMGSTAVDALYNYFNGIEGYIHVNTLVGNKSGFLALDVPRSELLNYMLHEDFYNNDLGLTYEDYLDALDDIISTTYGDYPEIHQVYIKYMDPCKFMECVGSCLSDVYNSFPQPNNLGSCSNYYASYAETLYDTYIDAWDNEPDYTAFRNALGPFDHSPVIECDPRAYMLALLKYDAGALLTRLDNDLFGILSVYADYFDDKYPPAVTPITDYMQYLIDYVPFDELAWYIEYYHLQYGGDLNSVLETKSDELGADSVSEIIKLYYADCAYKKCIIKTGVQSHTYTAYTFKQYLQTKVPLRDYIHSRLQLCYGDRYENKLVKTLSDQTTYNTFYNCGTRITQWGYDKYPYKYLINELSGDPAVMYTLAACNEDKLLKAAAKYNLKLLLTRIENNTPTLINDAVDYFDDFYTDPGHGSAPNYLAQEVPEDELLDYIKTFITSYIDDLSAYDFEDKVGLLKAYYQSCDFTSCTWDSVNTGYLPFDSANLITYVRDYYWPYLTRELYECNNDSFTHHAAFTRPYIISDLFENWHYSLDSFMTHVQAYYGSGVRDKIDVDTARVVQFLWANEWHMYGSSRVGVYQAQKDTVGGVVRSYQHRVSNDTVSGNYFTLDTLKYYKFGVDSFYNLHKGRRRYEGTNHLGNVLAVFTDKRISVCASDSVVYYKADVVNAYDYSAFGAMLPGRKWDSDTTLKARFGFNSMDRDDEIKGDGNSLDFGARIYDSRLGRWMSMDPKSEEYHAFSPYNFAINSPIGITDPDGNKIVIYYQKKGWFGWTRTKKIKISSWDDIDKLKSSKNQFCRKAYQSLKYLEKDEFAKGRLKDIMESSTKYKVQEAKGPESNEEMKDDYNNSYVNPVTSLKTNTVSWDPNIGEKQIISNESADESISLSHTPALLLFQGLDFLKRLNDNKGDLYIDIPSNRDNQGLGLVLGGASEIGSFSGFFKSVPIFLNKSNKTLNVPLLQQLVQENFEATNLSASQLGEQEFVIDPKSKDVKVEIQNNVTVSPTSTVDKAE